MMGKIIWTLKHIQSGSEISGLCLGHTQGFVGIYGLLSQTSPPARSATFVKQVHKQILLSHIFD